MILSAAEIRICLGLMISICQASDGWVETSGKYSCKQNEFQAGWILPRMIGCEMMCMCVCWTQMCDM